MGAPRSIVQSPDNGGRRQPNLPASLHSTTATCRLSYTRRAALRFQELVHQTLCRLGIAVGTSQLYADLMASARASGKAIGKADRYIAATAAENHLAVATRDTSPFEVAGLRVINPWAA